MKRHQTLRFCYVPIFRFDDARVSPILLLDTTSQRNCCLSLEGP
jgi:hypothetical protein